MFLPAFIIAPLDFQCITFFSSDFCQPMKKSQSSRTNIRIVFSYQLLKKYDFPSSLTADISRGSPDCVGMAETKSMIFSPASKVYNGILEKSCSMNQLSTGIPVPKPRHTSCSSASSDSKPSHEAASVPRISSIPQDMYQNGEKTKKPSKIKSLFKKKSK